MFTHVAKMYTTVPFVFVYPLFVFIEYGA